MNVKNLEKTMNVKNLEKTMELKCSFCEEMFEEKDGEWGTGDKKEKVFACDLCAYEVKYESQTDEEINEPIENKI